MVARALDIRYDGGYMPINGDDSIAEAFRELARVHDPQRADVNPFLHTSWRIRDAMPQAISIDNFIDSHRGDARLTICGKLAIARCILDAESNSTLFVNRREPYPKIDFSRVQPTWFNSFFQLLTENCQEPDLDDRLAKVAVVTFNYDRCIEHYLHGALQNYYGVSPERATQALAHLQVFHPYGSVGPLPWQQRAGSIDYGATVGGRNLIEAIKGLRTFTEGVDPDTSQVEAIRTTLRDASRLAFLGFAFHRLNLALLFPGLKEGEQVLNRPTFATGLGISRADCHEIANELSNLGAIFSERFQFRNELTCAGLFNEYWRSLGLS